MGKFIKKCMSMLLLVSIVSTSVFPRSFASYAQETQGEQIVNIDLADDTLVNSPPEAQTLSSETAATPEGAGEAVLKAGASDTQASPLGSENNIASKLRIKSVVLDVLGQDLVNPITGEKYEEGKESILIEADYDDAGFFEIVKNNISEIWIDEVSIPMRDIVKNIPNFYYYEGSITISAAYVDGIRAVEDFKKRKDHKVEIVFDDGSRKEYQDEFYVKRDFTKDPAPPPRTEKPSEPIDRMVKGYLVQKDNKKAKSMADDALVREIQVKSSDISPMPNVKFADIILSFSPLTSGEAKGKVKAVSYKTMNSMRAARPIPEKEGAYAISFPEFLLLPVGASSDTELEIELDIDLGNDKTMKQSAFLILDWNDDFKFEGEDPQPSPGEDTPKPGIADLYVIKNVAVESRYSVEQVEVTIQQKANEKGSISKSHIAQVSKVKINGVFFDQSEADFSQSYVYDFYSIEKKVVDQAKKKKPIEMEIWFKDGSMVKNTLKNDTPSQPDIPTEVKGYLLNKNETSVSFANKALRNIEVKPVVSAETQGKKYYELTLNFFSISISENETVEINKFLYQDGSQMKAAGTENSNLYTIYKILIPEDQVHSKDSKNDTKIAVQYNLNTQTEGFKDLFDATLFLDWNGDFKVPSDQPGSPGNFAEQFTIQRVQLKEDNKEIHIALNKALEANDVKLVKNVQIDNDKFVVESSNLTQLESGKVLVIKKDDIFNKAKEKSAKDWTLKVIFNDKSELSYLVKAMVQPPAPPITPGEELAAKYKIKSVALTSPTSNELRIAFDKKLSLQEAMDLQKKVKTIQVNDVTFEASKFNGNYYDGFTSFHKDVADAARNRTPIIIKITFIDNSVLTNGGDTPAPPAPPKPPQQGEGDASNFQIVEMTVKNQDGEKYFRVHLDKEAVSFWVNQFKKVNVDGTDFDLVPSDIRIFNKYIEFKKEEIIEKVLAVQDVNKMPIIIYFPDGSQLKKNVVEVPKEPKLTITSDLKDGEYTLTYQAYKHGSNAEISTLAGFFDVRAKLVVAGEKKTITLLNHTGADMMLDFAIKTGDNFTSIPRTNETRSFKGDIATGQYSFELSELTGRKVVTVLGNKQMGGNPGEIGQYENPNYKKADIVFDNEVIEGWTEFKFIEDAKKNAEGSHQRLIDGLIKNGVDANGDGQITEQELREARGITTRVADKMRSNVIDLQGIKIDDISMLKHLGPGIKFLNINGCGIKSLPQDVFQNATGVRELYLGGNQITELHPGTFDKMVNLEYIDFDGNRLGDIPQGIFDKNVALEKVSFMNSGVTSLPSGMLKNLSKLKLLYLQENSIKSLPDNFFEGAERLQEVYLHYNQLTSLPSSLGMLEKLKVISAQHNRITRVPDTLTNLQRLADLDLESNQIEYVPTALFENMIRLAAYTQVRLDLTMNNLKELPINEMIAALEGGGKMLTKFEVNKNYLKPILTTAEENRLKLVGIDFENSQETYYPQKGSFESTLVASKGSIELNQEFDILELFYWDLGDSRYYGGKQEFKTKEEFLKYLLEDGRDYHKIDRSLTRDEAIQKILNKKGIEWKVETILTKNDGQIVHKTFVENNPKEGLKQVFSDGNMKTGEEYTLLKRLLVKNVFGFENTLEYSVKATATSSGEAPQSNVKFVKVQINSSGQTTPSPMANQAINPVAKIEKIGEKYRYSIELRPITIAPGGPSGEVTELNLNIGGVEKNVPAKDITGEYNKRYVFELDSELKVIPITIKVNAMQGAKVPADLVFGDEVQAPQPQPQQPRMIKAYILKETEDKPSMANEALVHDVKIKPVGENYEVKLQFNPMTVGSITAGVDALTVVLSGSNKVIATKVSDGVFTFLIPASMVKDENSNEDTILSIEFTAKGSNFNKNYKARLLLDWNKNYVPQVEIPLEGRKIPAQILTKDGKKVSMAGHALEAITVKPSDKTSGSFKLMIMTFKFKELAMKKSNAAVDTLSGATVKAGVKTLEVKIRDKWMQATPVQDQKGVFTLDMFENVILDENATEDTRFAIRITTYPEVEGHTGPQEAMLVLDWNGDFKVDNDGNVITPPQPPVPPVTPPGGGGSGSTEETSYVNVWLKKKASNEASMGNGSLSQRAKVVRKGSDYTYTLTFNPMDVKIGDQTITGTVSSISLPNHPGANIVESTSGFSKEYTFTLNEKASELLISFEVDGVSAMGRQEAYVVFDWSGNNSAPIGGGSGGPGGAGGTTIVDNQVPLAGLGQSEKDLVEKAQRIINNKDTAKYKKYYKPETIKAISKALEAHQNKEKDALQKLQAVLETARLERINSILQVGYMSGYPNRQFRPNNKITRAEVSAMFMELIEDEAKQKVAFKDVKDGLWYSAAANKMASLGYIRMSEDGMFLPSKAITRAEYAYILAKLKNLPASDKKMKDVPADHWAASAIASCVEAGIIAGYSDGTFKPDREITRAEAVAMMSRTFEVASNSKNKQAYSDVSKTHWAYDVIMTASKN